MLNNEEVLNEILKDIQPLNTEDKTLIKAEGQVLAEDIYSDYNLPFCDTAGMDGYALISKDIEKADKNNPVDLEIIDTLGAGYITSKKVLPGSAIRIMTGSVLPEGADCVVKFEDTDEPEKKNGPNPGKPTHVKIYVSQEPGKCINKSGINIKKGDLLLPKGTVIGITQLSALTLIGKQSIKVIRRPKVAIITTGDELIKPGTSLTRGKVYNSNEVVLQSLVTHNGGVAKVIGVAHDNEKSLSDKIRKGFSADLIITTGGVSKGDYDLVRLVIGKMGTLLFSDIKMGLDFAYGLIDKSSNDKTQNRIPLFAIEGPPQSCMVDFEMMVRPILLKMRGIQELNHPVVEATSESSTSNVRPRYAFKWTTLKNTDTGYNAAINDALGLAPKAIANSLTIIPGGGEIKAGEKINILPLDWYK